MITRIVKMCFRPDEVANFIELFYLTQPFIHQFKGCIKTELLKDSVNPDQYFTLSYWQSETALENYRNSEFFKSTWKKVKPLFSQKAEAWTLTNQIPNLNK